MKIFVSHETALSFWRYHFPLDSELGRAISISAAEMSTSCKGPVTGSLPEEFAEEGRPTDILVFDEKLRRRSDAILCHVWETDLPPKAFYRARGVYVSSPEFVFLQMAQRLTIAQLIALGCELCGTYVLQPQSAARPSDLDQQPHRLSSLTSIAQIQEFLDSSGKANGKTKAQRALKYVVEGSRSPMETMTYMLLCLPPLLGGYGMAKPELNAEIPLDEEARKIARSRTCYGDLCWQKAHLDLEYHGEVHVGAAQMKHDVGRELAIETTGWRVLTVTSAQVLDEVQFDVLAREVAACLGKRLRSNVDARAYERSALRDQLASWMFARR